MALIQARACREAARMLSTRPKRNRRVDALSYVDTKQPWTLQSEQYTYKVEIMKLWDQTQWHSSKIAGLSAGRYGVQCSIPGRGE